MQRAEFQRRSLMLIEDDGASLAAIAARQDIVQVNVEGIPGVQARWRPAREGRELAPRSR